LRLSHARLIGSAFLLLVTLAWSVPAGASATRATWSTPKSVHRGFRLTELSCASSSFCLGFGVGETGVLSTTQWNGSRWSTPSPGPGAAVASVTMLSCVATSFCMAADGSESWLWDGHGWSRAIPFSDASDQGPPLTPAALSCASPQFCVAISSAGDDDVFNGQMWSSEIALPNPPAGAADPGGNLIEGLSCPSARSCAATDTSGYAFEWNGTRWETPLDATPPGNLFVSCPDPTWCLFINQQSYAATRNDHKWSGPLFVDPDSMQISQPAGEETPVSWSQGDFGVLGVSCASRTDCVAVDDAGYAVSFNGKTWSSPTRIGHGSDNLETVSCGAPDVCVAVVDQGLVTIQRT
jgi:hypothetical protein